MNISENTRAIERFSHIINNDCLKGEKTTGQYEIVPTIQPINVLRDNGWIVSDIKAQNAVKKENRGLQVHVVRLRHADYITKDGDFIEILIRNSHLGNCSFQFKLGVFRLVCSNGLVVGNTFKTERVIHKGYANDKVQEALTRITPEIPKINHAVNDWSAIELTKDEQGVFAKAASKLLVDEKTHEVYAPEKYLSRAYREADGARQETKNLWQSFNVVQENAVKGNFYKINKDTKRNSRARKLNPAADNSIKLNQALWTLAEEMAALKTAH